jgi:hypothetical protein
MGSDEERPDAPAEPGAAEAEEEDFGKLLERTFVAPARYDPGRRSSRGSSR